MDEAASLVHISKTYPNGVKALRDVSLSLKRGECTVLLGPNGAGKTTLIKLLTGLLLADSGEILVKGEKFSPESNLARLFGVALQEIGLWAHLTVEETLDFVGSLYRIHGQTLKERKTEILNLLDLEKFKKILFVELSEGLKHRLNLACALIHKPEILVLDEPSLGLDVHARLLLWQHLERLVQNHGIAVLLSTHDMEEADRLGDVVGILNQGELLALGALRELKDRYCRGDEVRLKLSSAVSSLPGDFFTNLPGVRIGSLTNGRATLFIHDSFISLRALFKALSDAGVTVEEFNVKPASLADVFLNLTGRSID